jgi:formate dehydrogenase maturation protein FdhE
MTRPTWDQRISRARELGEVYPFAAEVLAFYAAVASFQRDLYSHLRSTRGDTQFPGSSFRERLETVLVLPRFPIFLSLIRQVAPEPLSALAQQLAAAGQPHWEKLLYDSADIHQKRVALPLSLALTPSASEGEGERQGGVFAEAFLARAFLQPHAEFLVEQLPPSKPAGNTATCPACGAEPVVAVLREESLGAKRSLVCSLCSYEWEFPRALCPGCGEERPDALCVYTPEQFEHVRVDACDTCKTYIKTVDLTKNGLAIPVVDEIATLPLTLWAHENGYSKLQPNLMAV